MKNAGRAIFVRRERNQELLLCIRFHQNHSNNPVALNQERKKLMSQLTRTDEAQLRKMTASSWNKAQMGDEKKRIIGCHSKSFYTAVKTFCACHK